MSVTFLSCDVWPTWKIEILVLADVVKYFKDFSVHERQWLTDVQA